jgi:hypothetical protein
VSRTVVFTGDQISKQPQSLYEKMLLPFAEQSDVDIVVCICHGRYETMPQEMTFDKLYIFAQLLPREFDGVKKSTIKGFKIDGNDLLFPVKEDPKNPTISPCPQGDTLVFSKAPSRASIINDEAGVPMAAILDGNIYITNDFIHSRNKADFEAGSAELEYILKKAVDNGILVTLKSGIEEKSKRALEGALRQQFTQRLDKEIIQLKASKDTVTQYEKGIAEAMRKIISTEKIVEAIRRNIDDVPTALEKTWKALDRMKDSKSYSTISFTRTGIKAVTKEILCEYNKRTYDFGIFEVYLGFDGTCKIENLTKKVEHFDHPHVNRGQVCWGNFSGWIPKLIGSSEFDVALDQCYTFLCHYDAGNPYKSIDAWPLHKEEAKPSKKQEPEVMEVRF